MALRNQHLRLVAGPRGGPNMDANALLVAALANLPAEPPAAYRDYWTAADEALINREDVWEAVDGFGGTDSHKLRRKFMRIALTQGLFGSQIAMVYCLATICKNKKRLLDDWNSLPAALRENETVTAAKRFIETHMVRWVREETQASFALIHLPATNPGMCSYFWKITRRPEDRILENYLATPYATQVALDEDCQAQNRAAIELFWGKIRKTTNEANRREFEEKFGARGAFNPDIYATQAADTYKLMHMAMRGGEAAGLVYFYPAEGKVYTADDIRRWLALGPDWGELSPENYEDYGDAYFKSTDPPVQWRGGNRPAGADRPAQEDQGNLRGMGAGRPQADQGVEAEGAAEGGNIHQGQGGF